MTTQTTGLDPAAMIPAGATLAETSWHVAHQYGPSVEAYATEADALRAGIAEAEARVAQYPPGRHPAAVERLTIDLRWALRWDQGAPDANGRRTASCGIVTTIRRTTYDTLADAYAHFARINRYQGAVL